MIALATRRIEELSARAASIAEAIASSQARRPTGSSPHEIAMLDAIPDTCDALATADETELAEIFDAFDVKATNSHAVLFEATARAGSAFFHGRWSRSVERIARVAGLRFIVMKWIPGAPAASSCAACWVA